MPETERASLDKWNLGTTELWINLTLTIINDNDNYFTLYSGLHLYIAVYYRLHTYTIGKFLPKII